MAVPPDARLALARRVAAGLVLGLVASPLACDGDEGRCGPTSAVVARVVDGDTVELDSGERVRYLMIDTPETTGGKNDCYGAEAVAFNRQAVEGQRISLGYDEVCEDDFGRLLAYVSVGDREINTVMVERGYACVLQIPPNGEARKDEFDDLEYAARTGMVGVWGACDEVTCD
jgi:micrococcal nuclease